MCELPHVCCLSVSLSVCLSVCLCVLTLSSVRALRSFWL